ncbi:alpha/beta hydrolase domain-containing protein [Halopiger goleimassiliensis]|uniref:alpha/beta hydrolase domain-containing protein n=1 Tax=Halopiger goleimassiliensis TaxID=1293048 RepID=UPI000677D8FF|nr:alpha/beta hydrolase domain-containing protein [Halopiger goleimassiliensis]
MSDDPIQDDSRWSRSRRTVLRSLGVASAVGVVGTPTVLAGGDDHEIPETVPTPHVSRLSGGHATGQPQTSAVHDVSEYGYVEEEFMVAGEARPTTHPPVFFEEEAPALPEEHASYATRILVYRPADPEAFNGDVVVNWANVSTQRDAPVTWVNAYDYLMREGYAVVVASVQKVGVDDSAEGLDLVSWDPARYGDLHHPGDEYAFDIFSQLVKALRASPDVDPMGGLETEYVYATGESQSAGFLHPYITDVQPVHGMVDGFMPTAAVGSSEIVDAPVPVLWLNSEDEAPWLDPETGREIPNTKSFVLWEVAGASHVNFWLSAWYDVMNARDFDEEPDWFASDDPEWDPGYAGQYGQLEDAVYGVCGTNYTPSRYAYAAGVERLRNWVRHGEKPPEPPRIEHDGDDVASDEYGNALGGVRYPPIDVPVATYHARDEVCGGAEGESELLGATVRFDDAAIRELYGSVDRYVALMREAADEAVEQGYLLEPEREELLARARTIDGLPRN